MLLFSISFVISVLFGDVETEKNRLILCRWSVITGGNIFGDGVLVEDDRYLSNCKLKNIILT